MVMLLVWFISVTGQVLDTQWSVATFTTVDECNMWVESTVGDAPDGVTYHFNDNLVHVITNPDGTEVRAQCIDNTIWED